MNKITIYTTLFCPYCDRAKFLLMTKSLSYDEINVEHEEPRNLMILRSGGKKTVPQIFIGDFHVGGCDDLYNLDKEGKLDDLIKQYIS